MKAMENKKEPLMSAEEYFNTKNFGTDFDFAQDYANYVTQWHLNNAKEFVAGKAITNDDCNNWNCQGMSVDKQSIHTAIDNYIEINLNKEL